MAALMVGALILALAPSSLGQQSGTTDPGRAKTLLQDRWFFCFGYERNRKDVDKIKSLIDVAADHGLNGMVLSSFDLDGIEFWNEQDVALLKEVAAHCAEKQIELIPTGFSVGYGGAALGYDRNFAAAVPVTISVKAEGARLVPVSSGNLLLNGDLEEQTNGRFKGYGFHDRPGQVSFADTHAVSGKTSIRFENFGDFPHGHGRIMQRVAVKPGRMYRFTFKLKTEDLEPVSGLKAMVYVEDRALADIHPKVESTQDWTEVSLDYVNRELQEVFVYVGIWGGKSGRFWLDDLAFREYGDLTDIVRREGTPLELRSKDRDKVFEEGRDFKPIQCLKHLEAAPIPPRSSIHEGEQLELACYKIPYVELPWGKQISLCMSNPKLYAYWEAQAKRLHEVIKFKRFLLSMDEIRNGGGCASCRQRGISMAEILGDCVTRQQAILKAVDPRMEVMIWSDMLDPAHNAHNNYFGVVGDFTGSWQHVPKDLTMVCWDHEIRDKSLSFFSRQGFPTIGAAYYDSDDLTNPREWLTSLCNTPNAEGIIYTTWEKKYQLLADFGDLVSDTAAAQKDDPQKK